MLKGKISAGATKIRRYKERELSGHQKNLFAKKKQKQFYHRPDRRSNIPNKSPDVREVSEFWNNIWLIPEILTKMFHGSPK